MAKSKHKSHKQVRRPRPSAASGLMAGWTVTVLMTVACELGALVVKLLAREATPGWERLPVLAGLLIFASLVSGTVGLFLTAVVVRTQRPQPPPLAVLTAVVVGLVPWLTLAAMYLRDNG